jgi:Bacterial Ig domain
MHGIPLMIAWIIGVCGHNDAGEVELEWDPNPETDIAGYKVHYGTAPGEFTSSIDVGEVTMATVQRLAAGTTYFFVATAYNTGGLESPYSNEVTFTTAPNAAPVSIGSQVTAAEDRSVSVTLIASDPDGDPVSYAITGIPAFGTLSGTAPLLTYTPRLNFFGSDSFRFVASDGELVSAEAVVSITVAATNDPPTALSAAVTTTVEDAVSLTLAGTDPENSPLSFLVSSNSLQGALSGNPPVLVFTPNPGFVGTTSFLFKAHDGALTSPAATVQIRVVRPGAWEVIAVTDDLATGTNGAPFSAFTPPVRSDAGGDAAFHALVDSPAGSGSGIWVESEGALALVARQGYPAPGVDGGLFHSFPASPLFGGTGYLLVQATLEIGPGGVTAADDSGIWHLSPTSPFQLIAREGFAAGGGGTFLSFGSAGLGDGGKFAFSASIAANPAIGITSANDSGIWAGSDGSLIPVVRGGDPAPGNADKAKFDSLANTAVSVNSSGHLAFVGTLKTGSGTSKHGIWMWDGVQLKKVVRAGDPAPGALPEAVFLRPDAPLLRTTALVFHASLAGVGTSNDSGLWTFMNGSLSALALEGALAPGSGDGTVFDTFSRFPAGNDRGDIIFGANLCASGAVTSSNDSGIWARSPGTGNQIGLVARESFRAAQTPAGVVFASFDSAVVSGSGQEAFTASLAQGGSVSASNDRGLWMRSTDGRFLLLLREGDALPLSAEDVRIVSGIGLDGSSEFGAASFSGGASIKVTVTFTDSSSAVMSCTAP